MFAYELITRELVDSIVAYVEPRTQTLSQTVKSDVDDGDEEVAQAEAALAAVRAAFVQALQPQTAD